MSKIYQRGFTENSIISTRDGLFRISDLFETQEVHPLYVDKRFKQTKTEPSPVFELRPQMCTEIKTRSGYKLTASDDQRVVAWVKPEGKYRKEWSLVEIKNLNYGDEIALSRGNVCSTRGNWKVGYVIGTLAANANYHFQEDIEDHLPFETIIIDYRKGKGLFKYRGMYRKVVQWASDILTIASRSGRAMKCMALDNASEVKIGRKIVTASLASYLRNEFDFHYSKALKELPSNVLKQNLTAYGFLKLFAYFSAEFWTPKQYSTKEDRQVYLDLNSFHKPLLHEIQILLLSMGVLGKIRNSGTCIKGIHTAHGILSYKPTMYSLRLRGEAIERYIKKVGWVTTKSKPKPTTFGANKYDKHLNFIETVVSVESTGLQQVYGLVSAGKKVAVNGIVCEC